MEMEYGTLALAGKLHRGEELDMWEYEKRLQFPVSIHKTDPKAAMIIISQYGGPDGEMAASMRYLSQKFAFTDPRIAGVLNDIGSEASEMEFSEASAFFSVSKAPVTPFATVKLHLCGSIFK